MKSMFDDISYQISKSVTRKYSTSFSIAVKMLSKSTRQDIYNIYAFVRFADEIVDSFHEYDKLKLLEMFKSDFENSMILGVSLNPIINSFQHTVKKYNIPQELIEAFFKSMKFDIFKVSYESTTDYNEYIHGSADVVGLMCLCVFTDKNTDLYNKLSKYATKLGSGFQKVNFLRDIKEDIDVLNRTYFPHLYNVEFSDSVMASIVNEIETDFQIALDGIKLLPKNSRFGVYVAYIYYKELLKKIKDTPSSEVRKKRIRLSNFNKIFLLFKTYINFKLS